MTGKIDKNITQKVSLWDVLFEDDENVEKQ